MQNPSKFTRQTECWGPALRALTGPGCRDPSEVMVGANAGPPVVFVNPPFRPTPGKIRRNPCIDPPLLHPVHTKVKNNKIQGSRSKHNKKHPGSPQRFLFGEQTDCCLSGVDELAQSSIHADLPSFTPTPWAFKKCESEPPTHCGKTRYHPGGAGATAPQLPSFWEKTRCWFAIRPPPKSF